MSKQNYKETGPDIWEHLPHYLSPKTITAIFDDVLHYASQNEPDAITDAVIDRIREEIVPGYTDKQRHEFFTGGEGDG